jgi:hypothetical protein
LSAKIQGERGGKKIDLDWLLRVRVVVARCGEMDALRWWNTAGQLGPYGAKVLGRGFPRTHYFAQADAKPMNATTTE